MKKILLLIVLIVALACASNSSDDRIEIKSSCNDNTQSGNETGVDCGGDCKACITCDDGIMNGTETGVDCGGNCAPCKVVLAIPTSGYNAPSSYSGYALNWSDEFNGASLETTKWNYNLGNGCPTLCGWGNSEQQEFKNSSENLYFKDGNLIIEAKNDGSGYTSARINTDDKFEFKYGRIDIRASMPSAAGTWAALFLLNKNYTITSPATYWPSGGEIDIMEYLGENHNDILGTGHYGTDFPTNHYYNSIHYGAQNNKSFNEVYYVFSIIWEEDSIKWLVNNIEYHAMNPSTTAENGQPYPFNDNFYLIFALSVGGNLPTVSPTVSDFPAFMIIDYVRVYKKQ